MPTYTANLVAATTPEVRARLPETCPSCQQSKFGISNDGQRVICTKGACYTYWPLSDFTAPPAPAVEDTSRFGTRLIDKTSATQRALIPAVCPQCGDDMFTLAYDGRVMCSRDVCTWRRSFDELEAAAKAAPQEQPKHIDQKITEGTERRAEIRRALAGKETKVMTTKTTENSLMAGLVEAAKEIGGVLRDAAVAETAAAGADLFVSACKAACPEGYWPKVLDTGLGRRAASMLLPVGVILVTRTMPYKSGVAATAEKVAFTALRGVSAGTVREVYAVATPFIERVAALGALAAAGELGDGTGASEGRPE